MIIKLIVPHKEYTQHKSSSDPATLSAENQSNVGNFRRGVFGAKGLLDLDAESA